MKKIIKAIETFFKEFESQLPWLLLVVFTVIVAIAITYWGSEGELFQEASVVPKEQIKETEADKKELVRTIDFNLDLNGNGINEKILLFSKNSWDYQYSFFENDRLIGNIDFDTQKYEEPNCHVITSSRKEEYFFIVENLVATGSGISEYVDSWYKIGSDEIKKVLEYPVKGHLVGFGNGFDRRFKSWIVSHNVIKDTYTVDIEFRADYKNNYKYDNDSKYDEIRHLEDLFSINKKTRYVWDEEEEIFKIDILNSELSPEQIDGLYLDGNDEFLKHNFREVFNLARAGTNEQEKWVKLFLEDCSNTWEKTNLLALLSGSEPYIGKEVVYYGKLFRWSTSGELRFTYYDIEKDQVIDEPYYWFFAYLPNSDEANDMESYQEIVLPYLNFLTEENQGAVFKILGTRMMNETEYYSECEDCGTSVPLQQIEIDKIEAYKKNY